MDCLQPQREHCQHGYSVVAYIWSNPFSRARGLSRHAGRADDAFPAAAKLFPKEPCAGRSAKLL